MKLSGQTGGRCTINVSFIQLKLNISEMNLRMKLLRSYCSSDRINKGLPACQGGNPEKGNVSAVRKELRESLEKCVQVHHLVP